MPPLLTSAKLKPDFTIVNDEEERAKYLEEDGWEFIPIRGQQVGIKTSVLEEKNTAVEMLICYASEMKAAFQPYAEEVMKEIALPGLVFYYHDGVRSASAKLLPQLLHCIKLASNGNMTVLGHAWKPVLEKLLDLLKTEPSVELLSEFYQCFYECLEVVEADCLAEQHMDAFITSTESQINDYIRRLESRAADHRAGDVDLEQDEDALIAIESDEELLGEMSKAFHVLFKQHKTAFIPHWQRLRPYLTKFGTSQDASVRQWVVCVYDDLIEFCGPDSWQFKDDFLKPLAGGLLDEGIECHFFDLAADSIVSEVRQAAAYGVGCAGQHGGEVFAELVAASLPSLFRVIEQPGAREEDNVYATDNACCSIAKICRFNASKIADLNGVVFAWVKTLPVTHDEQDAPYAYRFLGELMER